ncbi:unnamed protein product [Calypogeia fissa]
MKIPSKFKGLDGSPIQDSCSPQDSPQDRELFCIRIPSVPDWPASYGPSCIEQIHRENYELRSVSQDSGRKDYRCRARSRYVSSRSVSRHTDSVGGLVRFDQIGRKSFTSTPLGQSGIPVIAVEPATGKMGNRGCWEDKVNELLQTGPHHSRIVASSGSEANAGVSNDYDQFQRAEVFSGTPAEASAREGEEEDWETLLDELPAPRTTSSPTVCEEFPLPSNGKSAVKQRGRGSFTNGAMGLYSDYFELNPDNDGPSDDSVDSDASRVLIIDCSSNITTKDVEEVVEPFYKEGNCSIRWVDNSRALATFSSPSMAREALVGISDGRFKVSMLSETDAGSQPSMSETVPSVPRPASSAQVAHRMIASALSRQGLNKELRAKNRGSLQEVQEQERQRKQRLQLRAQLRDEAWGSDED